ncbi:MAG TPA: adenylate/guanylate cyclase domain-containing protein [Solirubrobacteraceae bacterium]|nr:adenylate/guanylate cyclase domain-containing protein [Solirubrobacteraceae bacterium]
MAMRPGPTRYARSGDHHIAYSVTGDGPIDFLYVPTWLSQIEHLWDHPLVAEFFTRIAQRARLIMFDRRGTGMSDPYDKPPTLEEQMDDVIAVLEAAGSERAALFAQLDGGPMAILFAATHPERTLALVLYSTWARTLWAQDTPWANTAEARDAFVHDLVENWGTGTRLPALAPSLAQDREFVEWYGRLERLSAPPKVVRDMLLLAGDYDVRDVLPSIQVPTLVMHRGEDPLIDPRHAQYLAERIPGAKLVMLPGTDSLIVAGDAESAMDEIYEFFTGTRPVHEPDRILATVMFTDIVDSTRRAAELGDAGWRKVLERHDDLVRRQLERWQGREVKTTGDGFLATFDGPARAIRCGRAITEIVEPLGIRVRAGLHTGECEVRGDDVAGMAVHIGARVGSLAGPGEVLVSSTVKDLVVGSGIDFEDRGEHELKGVPGAWKVFAAQ